jgi:uncharacterized protein (DUF2249 family)
MISPDITVARLLEEHPDLVEVLARYHPHFKHLRNKLLRRVMAPRVTLAQAARIAGVSPNDLLATVSRAVGEADTTPQPTPSSEDEGKADERGGGPKPGWLSEMPESRQVHLDVREDIRGNREPFAKIMAAIKHLDPDQVLVLRTPFEPIPLYDVLGKRGFAHWTHKRSGDDWAVGFYREAASGSSPRKDELCQVDNLARVIDVRGLEPPEPMARVLEALEQLSPDQQLEVLLDRRPMFLYPQLDDRGFTHDTDNSHPGLVRIVIRREGAAP